jgi:cyclopropane fatty-acyl-phospholipid synthase-like methyltransferase
MQILSAPHKIASLKAANLIKGEAELIFYHTALEAGIFELLAVPDTADELAVKLSVKNRELFNSILELGVYLGGLSYKNGKYAIKGALSKAIASGHPAADWIREIVKYHGDAAANAAFFIRYGSSGDYLSDFGGVVAKSSRMAETAISAFIKRTIKKSRTHRILEIGCGSGEYLKYYAQVNPGNSGTGIDLNPKAVEIAHKSLAKNGIDQSFKVILENILKPVHLENESFDIATSYSNIYYFSETDRAVLFKRVLELLTPGGRFMLATMFKENTLISRYFDVIFTATKDLYHLPEINVLVKELKNSGFSKVKTVNLFGSMSFRGIVACK